MKKLNKKEWFVTYTVDGFGAQKVGPYCCQLEAQAQADDITGYTGVQNVKIIQQSYKQKVLDKHA